GRRRDIESKHWSTSFRRRRSVIVFFFSLPHLCRQRMPSSEDDDRDCRTDQTPAKDSDPGELPESEMRKQDRDQREHEFDDREPEGHAITRLGSRAAPWMAATMTAPYATLSR